MLALELNNNIVPQLKLQDSAAKALQLVNEFRVTHLPVVSEDKYLGLISEDELLDASPKALIEYLQDEFITASVNENEHFLQAVNFSNQHQSSLVPVTNNSGELLGTITSLSLLKMLGNFAGAQEPGGIIVLELERSQYSISEISRIVESNEATILHVNTILKPETGILSITLHLNKRELSSIVSAFERYEYAISYYLGEEKFENDIDTNYRHLMNYLDI